VSYGVLPRMALVLKMKSVSSCPAADVKHAAVRPLYGLPFVLPPFVEGCEVAADYQSFHAGFLH